MAALIDFITADDLQSTPDMADIASCMGIEFARQMIGEFGGMRLYVPRAISYRTAVVKYLSANRVKQLAQLQNELGCSSKTLLRRLAELE